eukprot:superscaffoldBa00002057_g13020
MSMKDMERQTLTKYGSFLVVKITSPDLPVPCLDSALSPCPHWSGGVSPPEADCSALCWEKLMEKLMKKLREQ